MNSFDFRGNVLVCPNGCDKLTPRYCSAVNTDMRIHLECEACSETDEMLSIREPAHVLRVWSEDGVTHMAWLLTGD